MSKTVTFETKCYEKDWQFIVKPSRMQQTIAGCQHKFERKVLFLNNFSDYGPVKRAADKLVADGTLDEYVVVADHATETLRSLGIEKESFKGGYNYSIAELVSIYLCKTEYLLHFSGDSRMEVGALPWVESAITVMQRQPEVLIANPTWNKRYDQADDESYHEDKDWYYSKGHFSDQCYLARTKEMRKKEVYASHHPASARYPAYGGELFEKRVDAYMRGHERTRITSKHTSYIHRNFPKNPFMSRLSRMIGK